MNAYSDGALAGLSAWDKRLIRRIDDAYEAARPPHGQQTDNSIPINDTASLRAMFRATAEARKAKSA